LLKIISLLTLMHYFVVVLPAPHELVLNVEHQAKPMPAKHYIVKPRDKTFNFGPLDIDQEVLSDPAITVLKLPQCTNFAQVVVVSTAGIFTVFNPRAPPQSFMDKYIRV
jgi:hypothetical protein